MQNVWQDLRYGVRPLLKKPGFTLVAIVTLALGIGAKTAIFSVVNAALLRQLAYQDADRLVPISVTLSNGMSDSFSLPDLEDIHAQAQTFEGIADETTQSINLTGTAQPERVRGGFVTANFFEIFKITPLAVVLSIIGLYGMMAYSVTQRTHEIGIRLALGAAPRNVLRLVVGQGMRLALFGIGLGVTASFALTRLMRGMLFEVQVTDEVTFIAIPMLLTLVSLLACYIPARRATKVAPLVALRYE